jgi:hypothetical protein
MESLLVVVCFVLLLVVIVLFATRKRAFTNTNPNETNFNSDFIYKDQGEDFDGFGDIEFIKNKDLPFVTVKFNYTNSNGEKSERTLGVNKIFKSDSFGEKHYYIRGFCHLKVAYRTFRIDRMSGLTNLVSGKIYENPKEFISLYN